MLAFLYFFVYTVFTCGLKWDEVVEHAPGDRRLVVNGYIEQMFLGQYRHTIDSKGRLTIPARFRDQLADGAYLTQGFDRNLRLVTAEAFKAVFEKLNMMKTTDPVARDLRRLIFATASQVDLDSVGRILIPQFLREVAGLDGEAVIVGVGEAVEIWSPEEWDQQITLMSNVDANAERFAELDL